MVQQAAAPTPGAMRDPFAYTPGDGRRYTWQGGRAEIVVEAMAVNRDTGEITFSPTGDRIPAPERRTAQSLMEAVDAWRWAT